MQVPTIKTLIKYRKDNDEEKNIICKFISEEDDYYAIENMILTSFPFETDHRIECHKHDEGDNVYEVLEYDSDYNEVGRTLVYFGYILTFSDKAFVLKEYKYDYIKFEDIDI